MLEWGVLIVVKPDHSGYHNDGSHNDIDCLIVLGFHFPPLLSVKFMLTGVVCWLHSNQQRDIPLPN